MNPSLGQIFGFVEFDSDGEKDNGFSLDGCGHPRDFVVAGVCHVLHVGRFYSFAADTGDHCGADSCNPGAKNNLSPAGFISKPLPPILGGLALVGGVVLIAAGQGKIKGKTGPASGPYKQCRGDGQR